MLQEDNSAYMERKTIRGSACQAASKSLSTYKRENNNVQYVKKCGNGPRQREQNSCTRKPMPQKYGSIHKCPASRSENCDNQKEEEVAEAFGSGLSQSFGPRQRKSNLNHLLNFTYVSNRSACPIFERNHGGRNGFNRRVFRYNKEQFLQANCQFAVRYGNDYSAHAVDPDVMVSWDLIEKVGLYGHEVPSCPICLYPPVAAKITRCGHIYCWSCILHYLSLDERSWSKCPICFESIHQKDLKSVSLLVRKPIGKSEEITMKLMKRVKSSVYAVPATETSLHNGPPSINDNIRAGYSKLVIVNKEDVQEMIRCEETALQCQLAEENGNTLESSFIESALTLLKEREMGLLNEQLKNSSICESLKMDEKGIVESDGTKHLCHVVASNETINVDQSICRGDIKNGCISHVEEDNGNDEPEENFVSVEEVVNELAEPYQDEIDKDPAHEKFSSNYFFYQAADGQHIYLHSINARCLLDEYKTWENCPSTITATVVYLESFSMTEELRKKLRYLSHVPLSCEFHVVELDLKAPVISHQTLTKYAGEIDRRHSVRERKQRDEKRKLKKMQEDENRRMGKYPEMRTPVYSMQHFPSVASNNYTIPSAFTASSNDSSDVTPSGSPYGGVNSDCSTSFARILKEKHTTQVEDWPKVVKSVTPLQGMIKSVRESDSEPEDSVHAPSYRESFGDAIQTALDSYKQGFDDADKVSLEKEKKTNKKCKQKKTLLFSTAMVRNK